MKQHGMLGLFLVAFCAGLPQVILAEQIAAPVQRMSEFGQQFAAAITRGDFATAEEMVDMDALLDRATAGVSAPDDFNRAFRQGIKLKTELLTSLFKATHDGGTYRLLRVRQVNGESRALFRLVVKDGSLNYHDWIVATDPQGRLRFQDVYMALTGEVISQTFRRVYVAGAVQASPTLLDRLTGSDKQYAANLAKMSQFSQEYRAGKCREALAMYRTMPKEMQENKSVMLLRFAAAHKLKGQAPQEYDGAIADFQRLFPGDPCLDLLCVGHATEE
jgi:hypothetical protein